jgi:hypothetical protein
MRKLLAASAILSADAAFVPAPMSASHDASNCGASAHSCRSGSARLVATMEEAGFGIKKAGSMSRDERLRSRYSGLKFVPEGGWADNAVDFSYDELSQSMNAIPTFSRGDVTTGSIIGFEPNGALVDIGVKSSAYVTLQEMALVKPDKPEKPQRTEPVREEAQAQIVPAHDVKPDKVEKSRQPKPAVVSKQERTFEAPERTSRLLDVHKPVTTAAGPGGLDTSSAMLHREAAPSTEFVSPEGLWAPAPVAMTRAATPAERKPVKRVVSPVEVRQDVPSLHIDAAAAPQAPRLNASTIRATAPPPAVKQAARAEAAVPSALQRADVSAAATPAVKKADKVEKSDKNDKSSGRRGSDKKHADDSDDPR